MADRFFVGDTDNDWNDSNNWSGTSGGGGGAGVPGTGDPAILDGNSPTAITIDVNANCASLDASAWATGIFTFSGTFYLRTYGDVTIAVGVTATGTGDFVIYEDVNGTGTSGAALIDFQDCTWGVNLHVGGVGSVINIDFVEDVNLTGKELVFHAISSTGVHTINSEVGDWTIFFNPTGGGEFFTNTTGTGGAGNVTGDMTIEFLGTIDCHFNVSTTTYGFGLNIKQSAGTTQIFGYNNSDICRVYQGFSYIKSGGTLNFHSNTPIPDFHTNTVAGTITLDFSTDAKTIDITFGTSGNTDVTMNSSGVDIIDHITYGGSGTHVVFNNNERLTINECGRDGDTINLHNRQFKGDTGIDFNTFWYEYNSTGVTTHQWKESLTYTFQVLFQLWNTGTGTIKLQSEHGTLRPTFHFYHNCTIDISSVDFTRIDALTVGQQLFSGQQSIITDCVGVKTAEVARAIQTGDDTDHDFYTDSIFDPVTVSGTVELSASPQVGARVHVITMQTEDGRDWFMLRHILTTNGSGEWTCSVPRNSTVFVSAHYDSGGTKYNSLSKPFISAS